MNKKDNIPQFETEEQEAEYWDKHSPLDVTTEPKAQRVRAKRPKDSPIAIRLDSVSRSKLEKVANDQGIGPSTLARLILISAIEDGKKLPKSITSDMEQTISVSKVNLQKALHLALDGDWRTALSLAREAVLTVPEEHYTYIKGEMQMIWSCIQRACVEPLLIRAEISVLNWDYDIAASAMADVLEICKAVQLPLDYDELWIRILGVAMATCTAAAGWKGDVDAKLNRVMSGMSHLYVAFEETMTESIERGEVLPRRVVG